MTSNKVSNSTTEGIFVNSSDPVTGNTIIQSPVAINFDCTVDNNVHSNTILGAVTGLANVATSVVSTNTYANVSTIRTGIPSGGCT